MALKLTQFGTLLILTVALAPLTLVHADDFDTTYYTITNVETHEIPSTQAPQISPAPASGALLQTLTNPLAGISISTIVNIGEQLWTIVQANKPVANVTLNTANALPQGTKNWDMLTGWQTPQARTYDTTYTNGFGMTVVDFQYQVSFIPGGSYQGQGQYLANVTVVPQNVEVAWGYTFNAHVSVPTITNTGTTQSPVAAAEVLVQWTVDTILKHDEQTQQYYVRGDGAFEAL